MYDKNIILIGYSGHGFVVADAALENQLNIIGYTERALISSNPFHLKHIGNESDSDFVGWSMEADFLIGVGDNYIREKIFKFPRYYCFRLYKVVCARRKLLFL